MKIKLPEKSNLPNGFEYPESFIKIVRLNLVDLEPWYIMDLEQILSRIKGLKERYPQRNLIPFAKRDDSDDIACFEVNKGETVHVIHDFASSGYEQRKSYNNFWQWFKEAIDEMINFDWR